METIQPVETKYQRLLRIDPENADRLLVLLQAEQGDAFTALQEERAKNFRKLGQQQTPSGYQSNDHIKYDSSGLPLVVDSQALPVPYGVSPNNEPVIPQKMPASGSVYAYDLGDQKIFTQTPIVSTTPTNKI